MRTLFLVAALSLPCLAYADKNCTDRPECWPEGSAMNTGLLAQQELKRVDRELNATYQRIMTALPPDEPDEHPQRSLIEAQRAWIKWRDAECNMVGEINGGVRMWKSANTVGCLAEMTKARTAELVKRFENND